MKRQLAPVLFLTIAGLLCGCATAGYQRASQARGSIDQARAVTISIQRDLDTAGNTLRNLTSTEVADLRLPYERFAAALKSLEVTADRLEPSRQSVITKEYAYVTAWKEELPAYQDSNLRARSSQRRDQVLENINRLNAEFHASERTLDPVLLGLKDMRRYLATDLTMTGVASVRDRAERLATEIGNAQRQLQLLVTELDQAAGDLSPVKSTQGNTLTAPTK